MAKSKQKNDLLKFMRKSDCSKKMLNSIFLPIIGQYDNIGDIILRRPLIDWLRPHGTLHLYLGHAPKGYAKGLALQPQDKIYKSFLAWYIAGIKVAIFGKAHYFFKPGEIQLTLRGMKEHVGMLPLLSIIRLSGGKVVRIGSGSRNFSAAPRILIQPSLALSQLTLWRDCSTAAYLGKGGVMPDLAFNEGDLSYPGISREKRRVLVVSMRGDRKPVPKSWINGIRKYAKNHGLSIWVVTQVLRDSSLSRFLTNKLDAQLLDWDGTEHDKQEEKLCQLYKNADIVISDRLHVLILAYTYGSLPVALLTDSSDKIERHFQTACIQNISFQTLNFKENDIQLSIESVVKNREAILSTLPVIREKLYKVKLMLSALLATDS